MAVFPEQHGFGAGAETFGALHRPGRRPGFAFELGYEVHDRTVRVVQTSPLALPS
ncbi:hypothetical protein [Streptomyces sp. KMM 9044]|uniref:hypothetical protein n=1 Tax=Streptomyces sp. KMM 9044 TaxID=2744474 RepID=UPI002150E8DE|nr:hypothetical protein [Streptomyces sp. KMM 9044]WAX81225.1 hypothetical protein HUV60_029790 [Streptomyces sp. KMM 9044]